MKLTKILTLLVMVFTLAFAGFAQDSTKTETKEAPKMEKKHSMKKGGMMKGEKKMKGASKHKKSAKKADADSTGTPAN